MRTPLTTSCTRLIVLTAVSIALVHGTVSFGETAPAAKKTLTDITVLELNQQIRDRKNKIENLRRQIATYERNIRTRQQEKITLENQISIIEDQVAKTELDIEATQDEIDQLGLEIQQADLEIKDKEDKLTLQKMRIGEVLRSLYQESQRDYLEILLMNDRFSDFFDSIRALEEVQDNLYASVVQARELREQLLVQKSTLENSKKRQEELQSKLTGEKESMEDQKNAKQTLIVQSVLSAEKYERLLAEARSEQNEINSDIVFLERTIREKLKIFGTGKVALAWPVDPTRGISAYFHDPTYPFRNVFEHPAIDIRAYQGSYVKAAEGGYVARVKYDGSTAYAYIMIIHEGGLATVYGHVSRAMVQQDTYVKKGQVIALSGAAPGTPGAGRLTTGPHLHFEVRSNGLPVDPLKYLP